MKPAESGEHLSVLYHERTVMIAFSFAFLLYIV